MDIWRKGLGDDPPPRRRPRVHVHVTRLQHRLIVAGGVVACGIISVYWPDQTHISTSIGTGANLFWLFVEPTS